MSQVMLSRAIELETIERSDGSEWSALMPIRFKYADEALYSNEGDRSIRYFEHLTNMHITVYTNIYTWTDTFNLSPSFRLPGCKVKPAQVNHVLDPEKINVVVRCMLWVCGVSLCVCATSEVCV